MSKRKYSSLDAYRAKRVGDATSEPFESATRGHGGLFVVQQHAARRLHFDLRLELDGLLKSWAVPKQPSPNPADKRLAVMVEDHPLDYGDFEGIIAPGNYGAGAVIVWDRGTWIPWKDPHAGLSSGKLLFELRGYKLRGKWTLVKTKGNDTDWLFIKERDGYVDTSETPYPADSILSGRTVQQVRDGFNPSIALAGTLKRQGATRTEGKRSNPRIMLATPGNPFSHKDWVYEIKYDGYRLLASLDHARARLLSRSGKDLSETFPEIVQAVAKLPYESLTLDGEVVVHNTDGIPDFGLLQQRGRLTRRIDVATASQRLPACFYVFDLLDAVNFDLRSLGLLERKRHLKSVLPTIGPLRFSDHVAQHGERMFEEIGKLGLEGMVAKRAEAAYSGGRSNDWLKITVGKRDDFVVVGYNFESKTTRTVRSLVLAQYCDGQLTYRGRVASGLDATTRHHLQARFNKATPLDDDAFRASVPGRNLYLVRPKLVCEVRFKELTRNGHLRQPVFLRLREDKLANECIGVLSNIDEPAAAPIEEKIHRHVQFTNLDKVFWPDSGLTKGDLLAYYQSVSPWLLPLLADRPIVLDRYPDGINGKSFFQKDAPASAPTWLQRKALFSEQSGREIHYFVIDDEAALLYVVNLGTIPIHVWSSRLGNLGRPDWCILDLDPKTAAFTHVVSIAKTINTLCKEIGLPNYIKTSGASGLHILIPLGGLYTHEQSRSLAEVLARTICRELPDLATVERNIAERHERVYVDFGQNGRGRLLVSTFSARAVPGASVSMPLQWREVNNRLDVRRYTILNASRRLSAFKHYPFERLLSENIDLEVILENLGRLFR